jgi:hypothetical protein
MFNDITPQDVEIISTVVGLLVSFIAVIISIFSLKLTQKSIEEANRPYVVVYRDYIQVLNNVHEYIVIKNFGKTGAIIDSIIFDPPYKETIRDREIFQNISNTFIAPGQSITTVATPNAFEGEREGIIKVTIRYHANKKKYEEKITLNEDLIKDIAFSKSTPSKNKSIETVVTKAAEEILRRGL